MPPPYPSNDEAQKYRYIVVNHRVRQFMYVLSMSKIDALLFNNRQIFNKNDIRCYPEIDAIKHFPSTAPLEFASND